MSVNSCDDRSEYDSRTSSSFRQSAERPIVSICMSFIFPSGPYNPYLTHARIIDGRVFCYGKRRKNGNIFAYIYSTLSFQGGERAKSRECVVIASSMSLVHKPACPWQHGAPLARESCRPYSSSNHASLIFLTCVCPGWAIFLFVRQVKLSAFSCRPVSSRPRGLIEGLATCRIYQLDAKHGQC